MVWLQESLKRRQSKLDLSHHLQAVMAPLRRDLPEIQNQNITIEEQKDRLQKAARGMTLAIYATAVGLGRTG